VFEIVPAVPHAIRPINVPAAQRMPAPWLGGRVCTARDHG